MMRKVKINDPRQPGKVKYPLLPTLFAIILAWLCGSNSSVKTAIFIRNKRDVLAKLIPGFVEELDYSHDTIHRLIQIIKFDELQAFLYEFSAHVEQYAKAESPSEYRTLAFDGQTPRAVIYEKEDGQKGSKDRREYHRDYYVTLYDCTNKLSIAQETVQDKENENKACVRLCQLMNLKGSVVTGDALNCQRAVAEAIIQSEGDYMLALKDNHKSLRKAVAEAFLKEELLDNEAQYCADAPIDAAHGRLESRMVIALPASAVKSRILGAWGKDVQTLFFMRTNSYDKKYGVYREPEVRYFLSSLSFDTPNIAEIGLKICRDHWKIENSLHYLLDVTFGQDSLQAKNREYIQNTLLLNKIAANVLRYAQANGKFGKNESIPQMMWDLLTTSLSKAIEIMTDYFTHPETLI